MKKYNSIGVFDSGVGGLSVLKKLVKTLPNENYLYFGDTARVPYGEKTKEQLIKFSRDILNWFNQKNVKAVLIACNTSSAVALDSIKNDYDFPIFGLIKPAANHVANLKSNKIGLIATSATVKSQAYSKAIKKIAPEKTILEIACPGLVEIVESDQIHTHNAKEHVNSYIKQLLTNNIEKIILGCTHYPYLAGVINEITQKPEMLLDPADYLIAEAKAELQNMDLLNDVPNGSRQYFVSSNPEKFVQVGNKFFSDCTTAKEIDLSLLEV